MKELNLTSSLSYSKEVELASKSLRATPIDVVSVDVLVNPTDGALDTFVTAEYSAIMYEVGASAEEAKAGTAVGFPVTKENFKKYCTTLIASRIGWVNNDLDLLVVRPTDRTCVPSILAQSLKAIGYVEKLDMGLVYRPSLEIPKDVEKSAWVKDHCLSADDMNQISLYLRRIENYVGSSAMPKDKQGSYDLCQLGIESESKRIVCWNSSVHPANALLAALPGVRYSVADYYKATVMYGDVNHMGRILCQLTSIQK